MIGNIRKILNIPVKVAEFISHKIRPNVLITDKEALSDKLLTDSYLITGIRVKFIYGPTVDRLNMDKSSIAEFSLENSDLIKLIPSLSRNFTTCCNEQVDINASTATILQKDTMSTLRDHLSRSHTERFKLVPLTPEDRYFKAWYALELVGTNLLTNQEAIMTISNTYWKIGLTKQDILQRVQSLGFEEILSRYASGLNQIV